MGNVNDKYKDQTDFSREDLESKFASTKGFKFIHRSGDISFFKKKDGSEPNNVIPASVRDMQDHV